MIETENLTKSFGDVLAVDRLTLKVKAGEVFGFLGPNGAGKTTTIRMLTALISPTSGDAAVLGWELGREDGQIRRQVGILTEAQGLYDGLSAERNLAFFARLYEVEHIPEQVERYLRMLGLWDRRAEAVGTFSKGMRQKLAIARALLHEPQVLFLDEPTSGLDVASRVELHAIMRDLQAGGTTIILATHDMAEAEEMSDRVAIMLRGELVTIGTPMEITATGAGFTKVSVRTTEAALLSDAHAIPAAGQRQVKDDYAIFFSTDIGSTVGAIIEAIETEEDTLIDLRVERLDHALGQIVEVRARRGVALDLRRDRAGFGGTDPDRQHTLAFLFLENDDGRVAGTIQSQVDDFHFK